RRDQDRHDDDQGHGVLSRQFGQGETRSWLQAKAQHRGRRARSYPSLPQPPHAQQLRRRLVLQRPHHEEARSKMNLARRVAVVTGGAGFIGSHMVDVLLERGYRVRVIDNLSGGRTANLAHHARDPDLSFEESDIRELASDASLFRAADYVFHFAGIGDIVPSIERPLEYMNTNVQGTVHVLEAARHARVRK